MNGGGAAAGGLGPDLSRHRCAAAGCRAFGAWGFGERWYCGPHRGEGAAWWARFAVAADADGDGRGGAAAGAAPGRQGSLF